VRFVRQELCSHCYFADRRQRFSGLLDAPSRNGTFRPDPWHYKSELRKRLEKEGAAGLATRRPVRGVSESSFRILAQEGHGLEQFS